MTKRMLIDATHAEETRVVVLDGSRLEDFDVETATKKQLKGNIYLAKVVRVEPSLQAAFVEYGGNRHGFLAFGEIHPDYYQIPVADRQRLLEMQAEDAREEAEEEDRAAAADEAAEQSGAARAPQDVESAADEGAPDDFPRDSSEPAVIEMAPEEIVGVGDEPVATPPAAAEIPPWERAQPLPIEIDRISAEPLVEAPSDHVVVHLDDDAVAAAPEYTESAGTETAAGEGADEGAPENFAVADTGENAPETIGGDTVEETREEARDRRPPPRFMRNYKIQEVIKRRQILLIQVVKEERGTKGAALTTYISLAGRFSVLMPNSPRGGGISRKITSATDRRRLKEATAELDLPKGMGLIVRTAGANRPKPEIKRDCEYLLRLWDDIREHTLRSVAPALIYEEASLIKRAIRDVYSRDVDEILVDGEEGWRAARDFMRMLMPSHARKVQLWREPAPLFARQGVEAQLDAMLSPTVQLKSGGYLVINQAEALVAVDVNSGRATRERNVEETALRTNLEAADEVARQLRLRDLAGLIVIDFIDMEVRRNNAMVERRLGDALKNDRARIQIGHISPFGLLEMSRQRLRPSLAETSFIACPHCGGTGHVRSVETAALHVLRQVEEEGAKRRAAEIVVHVASAVALYILNNKRLRLAEIEARHGMRVAFASDDTLLAPQIRIDRVRAQLPSDLLPAITPDVMPTPVPTEIPAAPETEDEEPEEELEGVTEAGEEPRGGEKTEEGERLRRRRRRRRGGGRREEAAAAAPLPTPPMGAFETTEGAQPEAGPGAPIEGAAEQAETGAPSAAEAEGDRTGRRRSRRGGRRRRGESETTLPPLAEPWAEQPDVPAYAGPTPADPFGGENFDIFAVLEQAEQAAEAEAAPGAVAEPAATAAESAPAAAAPPAAILPVAVEEPAPALKPRLEPEARAEPAIKPIIIEADAPAAEKKRGWWRR